MTLTQQYHRKPEPVEAVKLTPENAPEVAVWCGGEVAIFEKPSDPTDVATTVRFPTLNGIVVLPQGEYIVKNEKGAFCRVGAAEFERQYDIVTIPEEPYLPTN